MDLLARLRTLIHETMHALGVGYAEYGRERAEVQVDDTVYTVDVGEEFAESFKLLSTSGRCASLLFGDDQFSLCEGQEILK